jgi:predicted metal-dependent HD superfamily phosphohydrolase
VIEELSNWVIGMRGRWFELAKRLGIGEAAAEAVWLDLATAYGADGRFYHNLNHIQQLFHIADQLQDVATDFRAVQLAIWFHDIVYDPRQSDNEAQSAATAVRLLRPLGVLQATLTTVSNLILATQTHDANVTDPNTFVILDADLAILAAPPEQYDAYARAIRQEYSFVPQAAYKKGRTAVLRRFLARSPFYFTEWMRAWGETAVQQNLTRELYRLEKY